MTEIKPWKQRIENTTLMGPLATYQAMEAEIAELRAALSKSKAELDEWRFTNKIDEMQREIERLSAHVAKSQPVEQGEPVAWMWDEAKYPEGDLRGRQWVPRMGKSKPTNPWMTRNETPLYLQPVRPLTDAQIQDAFEKVASLHAIPVNGGSVVLSMAVGVEQAKEFARAIEAHIKGATATIPEQSGLTWRAE